jgi:hypothetical protein
VRTMRNFNGEMSMEKIKNLETGKLVEDFVDVYA